MNCINYYLTKATGDPMIIVVASGECRHISTVPKESTEMASHIVVLANQSLELHSREHDLRGLLDSIDGNEKEVEELKKILFRKEEQ